MCLVRHLVHSTSRLFIFKKSPEVQQKQTNDTSQHKLLVNSFKYTIHAIYENKQSPLNQCTDHSFNKGTLRHRVIEIHVISVTLPRTVRIFIFFLHTKFSS